MEYRRSVKAALFDVATHEVLNWFEELKRRVPAPQ
jgi:hypothetical protein